MNINLKFISSCDSDESTKKLEIYLNYFRKLYFKKIEKIQQKKQKEAINSKKYLPTSQNEHLINSNLKENFIQRQINKISSGSQHRQHENSNSSAGTHSTSSHNDLSLISPVNSNSSLNFKHHGRPTSPNIKNINDELIGKIKKGEPLLYPPKDYTKTLVKRGNLPDANNRRSRNPLIVGKEGLKMRDQNLMNLELNDSFMSDHFSPRNLSFNGSNTNRSDYNLDEQQVLNLLDEVVDSVSMVPEYRYEPIMEHKQRDEPDLFNSISSDNFIENSLQMIEEENPFISNRLRTEQDFFNKRNLNNIKEVSRKNNKKPTSTETPYRRKLFSFSGSKSDKESNPSVNNSMSAASIGVRTNVLTKLGNFKPKIIIDTHQQPQYYGSKNDELKQNVYSPYKADYASNSGLRRISEETNNLYVSNNNHSNSEFILKPTDYRVHNDENNEKYKNYVQVQKNNLLGTLINVNATSNNNISRKINNNFKNYQNPNQYNQNVINVYELNRRFDYGEAKRYDLNDIYY